MRPEDDEVVEQGAQPEPSEQPVAEVVPPAPPAAEQPAEVAPAASASAEEPAERMAPAAPASAEEPAADEPAEVAPAAPAAADEPAEVAPARAGGEERPRPVSAERRPRRHFGRRKVCNFCVDKVTAIDYKDAGRLRRYLSDRGRIEARRKTGTCAKHQRWLALALKRARHLALLPYTPDHIRATGMFAARR